MKKPSLTPTSPADLYLPELDEGEAGRGKAYYSANVWVPKELVRDPGRFIRAATVEGKPDHKGNLRSFSLVRETAHHLVCPRHLYPDWPEKLSKCESVVINPTITGTTFQDNITPRNQPQQAAWDALSLAKNGVLNLSCGKGKTVLALKKMAQRRAPAVVVVNSTTLIDQWRERAIEHLDMDDGDIGEVRGKKEQWGNRLVLCTIQTLAKRAASLPLDVRLRFGLAFYDEVHHLSAAKFAQTADLFFGERFGLTATTEREDALEDVYYSHLGGVFHSDLQGELEAKIFFKKLSTRLTVDKYLDKIGEPNIGRMYIAMSQIRHRNRYIINDLLPALESGRKILVLSHAAEHPLHFAQAFEEMGHSKSYKHGIVIQKTKNRREVIQQSDITFATMGVASEALDVEELDTVAFVTPFQAWGQFSQGKGRIERIREGKKDPIVLVYEDYLIGQASGLISKLKKNIRKHDRTFSVVRS